MYMCAHTGVSQRGSMNILKLGVLSALVWTLDLGEKRLVRLILPSYWELTETLESQKNMVSQWQPMTSIHQRGTLTHIDMIIYTNNTIHAFF